ncbi:hypothetical protein PIB30_033517 [Stylosanthes scabra]|uniref:C2H2-type domain-containing protein n=1 Tax=Stylosanthes scabra TaxID=79078 RepID=A0ABU6RCP8_9FABA|nr:hypothetical protein [Stylosanthes scabra]
MDLKSCNRKCNHSYRAFGRITDFWRHSLTTHPFLLHLSRRLPPPAAKLSPAPLFSVLCSPRCRRISLSSFPLLTASGAAATAFSSTKTLSMATASHAQAVKSLNKSPGRRRFVELNTAEDFITLYEEVLPCTQSLALVLLRKESLISKLLSRLHLKARLSLEPILRYASIAGLLIA